MTLQCLTLTDDASRVSFVSYTGDVGYEVDSGRAGAVVGCGRSLVSCDLSQEGNPPHLPSAPVLEKTQPGLGFWAGHYVALCRALWNAIHFQFTVQSHLIGGWFEAKKMSAYGCL